MPSNAEGVDALAQLTLDLQWSWNHAGEIWNLLDPQLWELSHKSIRHTDSSTSGALAALGLHIKQERSKYA